MSWYDVENILLDGSKEEIAALKCPECGGELKYRYSAGNKANSGTLRIYCNSCYIVETLHGMSGEPNCITLA